MTTLKIEDPEIERKYSAYEIRLKFLSFLENELKEDHVELFQISFNDVPKKTRTRWDDINNLHFVDY